MIAGKDAVRHGEDKNSWLTGTAVWNFVTISQWILGIKPDFHGLKVDPCIPAEWDGFSIKREFRGSILDIKVVNNSHVSKGVKFLTVDGKVMEGNVIPPFAAGTTHEVMVEMG